MHGFSESVIPLCLFIVFLSFVYYYYLLCVTFDVKHFELPLCLKMLPYLTLPATRAAGYWKQMALEIIFC